MSVGMLIRPTGRGHKQNGREFFSETNSAGLTEFVKSDLPTIAKTEAPFYGDSTSCINADRQEGACSC